MENILFCFYILFAAVHFLECNKWSYSYGFLSDSALLSDKVVYVRYESPILIASLCSWTCLLR